MFYYYVITVMSPGIDIQKIYLFNKYLSIRYALMICRNKIYHTWFQYE